MSRVPEGLRYTREHEWARVEGERVRVGITDHAQEKLGDVVYVELPAPGKVLEAMQAFGVVESVKAVAELFAPVAGEVLEVNAALDKQPELVNADPYGDGWMIVLRPGRPEDFEALLSPHDYATLVQGD